MKHNRFISIAIIGSAMLLTASCVEEVTSNEDLYRPAGTPIVFSAATSYANAPETRAEYSGDLFNGPLSSTTPAYERIFWENGDKIRIVHNSTGANYTVSSGTNVTGERESLATLSGGNLVWDGSGSHTFYGLYPCTGTTVSSTSGALTNAGVVSGTIPATQNIVSGNTLSATEGSVTYDKYRPDTDHYGYMAAYATVAANSGVYEVKLPFRPAFTCFEFKLQRDGSTTYDPAITSFELKTVEVNGTHTPLTGGFSFQISGGDQYGATWTTPTAASITNKGYSITVGGFPGGEVHVPTSGYLDFSILALPIDLTGVELIIHYANNATKTLKFMNSGVWHQFTGAKKYVITNVNVPDADYIYIVEDIIDYTTYGHDPQSYGFNVKSYRYNSLIGPSSKEAVTWKLKYSTDGGTTWADVATNGTTGSGSDHTITNNNGGAGATIVTGTGVSTSTYTAGEPREANINGQAASNVPSTNTIPAIRADLRTRGNRGTEQAPWDLSKHDIFGNSHTMTTANSYVVDRPGWYMFPVVYGNGITNGAINADAYRPGEGGDSHVTLSSIFTNHWADTDFRYFRDFFDAAGGGINHPVITASYQNWGPGNSNYTVQDMDAVIVWQNSMTTVNNHGEAIVSSAPELVDVATGVVGTIKYIKFQVKPEDIQPGNIVIAFRGKVPGRGLTDKVILWSWQIWVTQADLTPITVDTDVAFMPRNLGAVDKTDADIRQYADRSIIYKVIQTDGNGNERTIGIHTGAEDVFTVEEIGDAQTVEANQGNNPFYQWGRKDPMVPVNPDGTNAVQTILAGSGYSNYNVILNVSYSGYADVKPAIQNPHRLCHNGGKATWIGGLDYSGANAASFPNAAAYGCLPYNLWNSAIWKSMDAGGSDKYKTVYDPCPPGFCVPNVGAVSNFSSAVAATTGTTYNTGSATLFFPLTGLRTYHPGTFDTEHVGGDGHFWTDCPEDGTATSSDPDQAGWIVVRWEFAKNFSYNQTTVMVPSIGYFHAGDVTYTRGSGFAIRPMVDPKY